MDNIIYIHEDLELIKSALLQVFSDPLTEEECEVLISCFLDELVLHSDDALNIAYEVGNFWEFLKNKAVPRFMKARQDMKNRIVLKKEVKGFDESSSPF